MQSPIEQAISTIQAHKPLILVDDADRENEGDVILPLAAVTPQNIHFLMRQCRGMICLALEKNHAEKLGLEAPSSSSQLSKYGTPFMKSIDARTCDTGISAEEIAKTIHAAGNVSANSSDVTFPGHVATLMASQGGVLVRAGHTEAAIDLSRLAGQPPVGVLCEILSPDGSMTRGQGLKSFAKRHDMQIFTIADLIAWRLRHDHFVERVETGEITNRHGSFHMIVYRTTFSPDRRHFVFFHNDAILQGKPETPVVRVHPFNLLDDACHDQHGGRDQYLDQAFAMVRAHEQGVLVIIQNTDAATLNKRQRDYTASTGQMWLREYGLGAQILLDMNISTMRLLTHSSPNLAAFGGFGIDIVETLTMPATTTDS